MFGLFNVKPARRLGAISYDLYLVHGLILAAAFALPGVKATALSSPACVLANARGHRVRRSCGCSYASRPRRTARSGIGPKIADFARAR